MKKYSCYNRIFYAGENIILYNCASDGTIILLPEIEELLQSCEEKPEELANLHNELYQSMLDKRMIVDTDVNECEQVIEEWKKEDSDNKSFKITINPTMDCNLRCWYCYEKHMKGTKMTLRLVEAVKELIRKKTENPELEELHLDFFGGEPLLGFEESVLPLLEYSKKQCKECNVELSVSFTTNGVLLTNNVIEQLREYSSKQNPLFLQITLDGGEKMHNLTRKTEKGETTYSTIVSNIKGALSSEFRINLRLNYTNRTAASFVDIIKDFSSITPEQKSLLSIDFKKVWQDAESDETERVIDETRSWMEKEKLNISHASDFGKTRCYADKENDIVINYNGDLYKCTARNFTSSGREGILNEYGELVWNEKYKRRMEIKYGGEVCRQCDIFPVCHGGCSQDKLEINAENGCIRGYDDEKKEAILAGRMKYLLKSFTQQ
ncbi:MAG: radical SAM protein [Bacteroidaceae bacterium]